MRQRHPRDAHFCPQCGTPPAVSCAACGHANAPGSHFCAQCAVKLGEAASTPPAATAPLRRRPRRAWRAVAELN